MRLRAVIFVVIACAGVGAAAQRIAEAAAAGIERVTADEIAEGLAAAGEDWARAATDGLTVTLIGAAPDEASRLRAAEILRRIVDPRRVRDAATLADRPEPAAPAFAVELLRDDAGVSLIGLAPASARATIRQALAREGLDAGLRDMLESVEHPAPAGWDAALAFGLAALGDLPDSRVSVTPGAVAVTALAENEAARRTHEANLRAARPDDVALELALEAPRPVIAPFVLSFRIKDGAPELLRCVAETPEDAAVIAAAAGLEAARCAIGLGAPSSDWIDAATAGIRTVRELGSGGFALSDFGATLTASADTPAERLQAAGAALTRTLPAGFALAVAVAAPTPAAETADAATPRFVATLRADGQVRLDGPLQADISRDAVIGYAAALFGRDDVTADVDLDAALPPGWPGRVLAGLEGLALLREGELVVTGTGATLRGWAAAPDGAAQAGAVFAAAGLPTAGIALNFDAAAAAAEAEAEAVEADPVGACAAAVADVLSTGAIAFEPGSTRLQPGGKEVIAAIAAVMADCPPVDFEIAGHTDSQGGADSNQRLSEERAVAVKTALDATGLAHMRFVARGYGADRPIADNATDEGRARNRRIEFTLIADAAPALDAPFPETPFGPR